MARDWRTLSTELARVSTLLGAGGAATAPTPAVGLLAGISVAVERWRRPGNRRQDDLPDRGLMRARLRAAVEQGSLAGKAGLRRPTPEG